MKKAPQRSCRICRRGFAWSKFHPYQRVCRRVACRRRQRQLLTAAWRKRNRQYWKGWTRDTREASRRWRQAHPGYYQEYRQQHTRT